MFSNFSQKTVLDLLDLLDLLDEVFGMLFLLRICFCLNADCPD